MHFFDLAILAAYFEYKRDCIKANIDNKDQLKLVDFEFYLCSTLIQFKSKPKRGNNFDSISSLVLEN